MFKAEFIFVRLLFPMLIGIIIFYFINVAEWKIILSAGIGVLLAVLFFINFYYQNIKIYRNKGLIGIGIYLLFFCFGAWLSLFHNERLNTNYFHKQKADAFKAYVLDDPQIKNGVLRFKAQITTSYKKNIGLPSSGKILVAIKLNNLKPLSINYGDEFIMPANFNEVEPAYNPYEFNYKAWLASQNIYDQSFLPQEKIVKTFKNQGNVVIRFAIDLRKKQVEKFKNLIKDAEAFAVASTLILGYRANLSNETLSTYSKTGTIHALSVSGAHVGIIYLILNFLLSFLNKNKHLKFVKFFSIIICIWVYSLITGLSPAVVRSAIMISLLVYSKTYHQNSNPYNILAFSAFCQLLFNPFIIWDVGFQLSYLAVFGLIYVQPLLHQSIYIKNKWLDKLWQAIALSLAAQCVTFPLSIYYFHQFPVYFLLGNLFILIPLSLMMYIGILVLIFPTPIIAHVLETLIIFCNNSLHWIAKLPFSTVSAIYLQGEMLLTLSLTLILGFIAFQIRSKKLLFLSILSFLFYQSFTTYLECKSWYQKEIMFFSLRKNFAVAFIHGQTAILKTDLQLEDVNFNYTIKPYLDAHKISNLILINTNRDTLINDFIQKDNQIVFKNHSILIIDEKHNYKSVKTQYQFDQIWLQRNTKFDVNQLKHHFVFKQLIVDASNKDYRIKEFKSFALNNKIESIILKKNNSYLINLNQ